MGYIYCITNLINSKRYVGKTTQTPEERFKEHCKDAFKDRCSKRPLYDAFNKYGIENFEVEELEYVEDNNMLSEREVYWINELSTYGRNGYNATKGGDGSILYDHEEILSLYGLGYSALQISEKVKCERTLVTKVLRAHGIKSRGNSKIVLQFDLAGNFIQEFDSTIKAEEWLISHGLTSSKQAHCVVVRNCKGEQNSAYGYKWQYKQLPD